MTANTEITPTIEQIIQLRKLFFEKLEKDGAPVPGTCKLIN